MTAQYLLDPSAGLGRIVEAALSEYRRIACRYQEHITLAQRHVDRLTLRNAPIASSATVESLIRGAERSRRPSSWATSMGKISAFG
jgi:hypothetical protein